MKWAHLPNTGGLYDQDPDLLDRFEVIFAMIAQQEEEDRKKQERERKQAARSSKASPRSARMRSR